MIFKNIVPEKIVIFSIAVILFFIAFSCKKATREGRLTFANSSQEQAYALIDTGQSIYRSANLKEASLSFYNWYIKYECSDSRQPKLNIVLCDNGKYCLQNTDYYFNSLNQMKTLSDSFKEREYQRLIHCKKYLENVSVDLNELLTLQEITDDSPCNFMDYKYWFKSQECAESAEIESIDFKNDTAFVILRFYSIVNNKSHYQYFKAHQTLIMQNDQWILDEIIIMTF